MEFIEATGKNINEALKNALNQLKTTQDKIEYTVLDEGSKGFLNIIGVKPVKISVKLKKDAVLDAKKFLQAILMKMNVKADILINEVNKDLHINITGQNIGTIIGYRGETLDSLQYLVSLVVNKNNESSYKRVFLDAENYRAKRQETLKLLADRTANKAKRYKKPIRLEPMNSYERRVIHGALQNNNEVKTYSEGEEPFRRVVVDIR
ncbi:MAG: RNA-binding cell elongation regulator Jag/EloR [Clostridium perfringens]|nr:RNA-binding cell elongation regulator Jag/EloR [Clostridium perfringens]